MKISNIIVFSLTTIVLLTPLTLVFASKTTVNITTDEWNVLSDRTSAKAGKITFVIKNLGHDEHELEIVKIGAKKHNMLPLGEHSSVDEKWLKTVAIDEIEVLKPGKTKSFSVNLTPGNYALLCNRVEAEADGSIEAHYHMGMSVAFIVE